jgi:peptidyl-prolyl cis-trans isomerase B (cyclophilin B)
MSRCNCRGGFRRSVLMRAGAILLLAGPAAPSHAQAPHRLDGLTANLKLQSHYVQVGKPVWAFLSLENTTDQAITLTVPGLKPQIPSPEMGLPLAHVFSGESGSGVVVVAESGRVWEMPTSYHLPKEAPILTIAPQGLVGAKLDLRKYYPALRGVGIFRITWKPYNGTISSHTIVCEVAPLKQAEILTDFGRITAKFFYEDAPRTVANFIDLAKDGFYSNLTFHRLEPGYLLLGGCPRGDGTGIRPDGKRIPAEFNSLPHEKGTISMALLDDDPDSASCQFFICNTRQKDWDGRYTVFAQLIGEESFETLDRLMTTPVREGGQPEHALYIRSIRIANAPYTPPTPGE